MTSILELGDDAEVRSLVTVIYEATTQLSQIKDVTNSKGN